VIRLAPPLTITESEIDWAFERIAKVIARMQKSWRDCGLSCRTQRRRALLYPRLLGFRDL